MKLGRLRVPDGTPKVFLLEDDDVWISDHSDPLEVLKVGNGVRREKPLRWNELLSGAVPGYKVLAPIEPPEVWAYGFTYERGPQFAKSPMIPKGDAYTAAASSNRPEIFFKTTALRVVGPNDCIGIRRDSVYTAVEAELCLIIDKEGRPVLCTAGNDVSAWDIEAMNPLWLAQGKTFEACCALGPVAVTMDELPRHAQVSCRIVRGEVELFHDSIALDKMRWSFDELADFAGAFNPLLEGTVLMTGTAIIRPDRESLAEGDVVEIAIDGIGTLTNTGRHIDSKVPTTPYH